MNIGAMVVRLRLPENHSLKGKRKTVKSITAQVASKLAGTRTRSCPG